MNPENLLAGTASLFMALGDKTRLRLLNLMRDREICVSSFTGTLGHSQPLISRHLALPPEQRDRRSAARWKVDPLQHRQQSR
jgi:DNA-binding transcriptional ArsR family regulator